MSADYGGQFLWELIQNADDALSPDGMSTTHLIGTKGLGFKSVLEISDRPEVFSNAFAFRFCRTASESLLSELLSTKVVAPTFEIPHSAKASLEVAKLLKEGYATVIRLPFRDTQTSKKVHDAIISLDSRFLLFSQNIQQLRVVMGQSDITTRIERSHENDDYERIALSTRGNDVASTKQFWTKWFDNWDTEKKTND